MDNFFIGLICLIVGIAIGAVSWRHYYLNSDNNHYYQIYQERDRYFINMRRLDISPEQSEENIRSFHGLDELRKANTEIERSLMKYAL